ncbi:MAG: tetratricopeptide repeat protein [Planctomycetaceae bacterium]|nr:tetratricopeptide repeat protein [Planctomycetaceae bacterium]
MAVAVVLLSSGHCRGDDPKATAAYLAGLDALAAARWADALASFTAATEADEDNADYRTARGVSLVISQKFPAAIKDLQRSMRLRADDWETKLWLHAAIKMSGDAGTASQYVTHGPTGRGATAKADLDYSTFMIMLSQKYWEAATRGQHVDYRTQKTYTAADIAAAEFPKAAAFFAQRRLGSAPRPVAGAVLERVKAAMQNRQYAAAIKDLDSLLAASPEDDALLVLHAEAALGLGDYSGSRSEYTRVLTRQPGLAAAYLGRAQAAAGMGDTARARADLATAGRLNSAEAPAVRARLQQILSAQEAAPMPAAMAELEKAAADGAAQTKLDDLAKALVRAVNARRLRYDEIYQDRLRVLDEALRTQPRNPDRLADLAEFLFRESDVPFDRVEPRGWPIYYRFVPQTLPKFGPAGELLPPPPPQRTAGEVARAAAFADEAVKAGPNHVRSLYIKGKILNAQGQFEQALAVLDKAVAGKPGDAVLLRERSVAEQGLARENMLAATALRGPKISTVNNQDGTSTTTTVYPSSADLARANVLERAAKEFGRKAGEDMTAAQKLTAGTAMGAYYQGLVDYAYHNVKQAQTDFLEAVRLDPKFRDAWEQLAKVNLELKLPEEWAAARIGAMGSIHTTAGPWLTVAREMIVKTKYKAAREALAEARKLDPADARIEAYQAVIEADNDKPEAAAARYRMALALEGARLAMHGRSLAKDGPLAMEPADIGLVLVLRNRAAALLFAQGKVAEASALFGANAALLSALPQEKLATPVPLAVLPSSTGDASTPAINETYGGLKVRSEAGMEYTAWARQNGDAKDVALASQTFGRLVVDFHVTDPNPEVLQAVISLGLAELHVSKGNFAKARELLRNEGATPQPLWQEMRKVEQQIRQSR